MDGVILPPPSQKNEGERETGDTANNYRTNSQHLSNIFLGFSSTSFPSHCALLPPPPKLRFFHHKTQNMKRDTIKYEYTKIRKCEIDEP
ncbi:hypothetical protein J7296_00906 [Nakaseomyces glabratus]|nr:hypothetical protein J7296_00906 [Nakaseomyces glabratus]